MNLGQVIEKLKSLDPDLVFKNGIGRPESYRGDYSCISFRPATDISVQTMLDWAVQANGVTMTGYKGGDYKMDEHTECYIAEYSETGPPLCEAFFDLGARFAADKQRRLAPVMAIKFNAVYDLDKTHHGRNQRERIIDRTIEELGELIAALVRLKRESWDDPVRGNSSGAINQVHTEYHDVLFCFAFLEKVLELEEEQPDHEMERRLDRVGRALRRLLKDGEDPWVTFTRRTNEPKLIWLEGQLEDADIAYRRAGHSHHAPILKVRRSQIIAAQAILEPVDDVPDDDEQFQLDALMADL